LRRVDQALGRVDEPLTPIVAPPVYHSLRYLLEPIFTHEAIAAHANRLMQTLSHVLARDDAGARALRLCLYNVDGAVEAIDIGLTQPTRSVAHVARLVALKLEALAARCEAGFGFEAIGLAVTCAEPMPAEQTELAAIAADRDRTERCANLIDALRQRLGPQSVRRFEAVASHLPERAEVLSPIDDMPPPARGRTTTAGRQVGVSAHTDPSLDRLRRSDPPLSGEGQEQPRPLLILPHAEPAEEVMALIPDGPPRRFSWRGTTYEVSGAQGPERLGAEWWRHREPKPTRDYYLVEDTAGQRFWLFREGLYGRETSQAQWYVHGLFA
jgi:protein ImuB